VTLAVALSTSAILAFASPATRSILAQTEAAPSASASSIGDVDKRKDVAKEHFLKGVDLMDKQAWDAALAEFMVALVAYPTSNTRKNAALCLQKLQRFDEALEMWQARLKQFGPQLTPAEMDASNKAILELKPLVGYLEIECDTDGASVVIDGRERGRTPLGVPVIVSAGTRLVRIVKEGFVPFEAKPSVAGKATVKLEAHMEALVRSGRLRVVEEDGKVVDVLVDGVVVGQTPNENVLPPGPHAVHLRGEGNLGTQPAAVKIEVDQTVVLRLRVEELASEGRLKIEPVGASVVLDGVPLGIGSWAGRLRAGAHKVEASAEGYFAAAKSFEAPAGVRTEVAIALDRDESSPIWAAQKTRYRFGIAASFGALLGASMGGDYESTCATTAKCEGRSRPFGILAGLRGSYEFAPRFSAEIALGFGSISLTNTRSMDLRAESALVPVQITDKFAIAGPFLTLGASYLLVREPVSLSAGIGVGVLLGRARDDRTGTVATDDDPKHAFYPYGSDPILAVIPLIVPEVRLALPLGERFRHGISLAGILGFADVRPRIEQAATPNAKGENPQHDGKFIGIVPQQGSTPESAVGPFFLGAASLFCATVF
jgi:hypothetical protein